MKQKKSHAVVANKQAVATSSGRRGQGSKTQENNVWARALDQSRLIQQER